jgi:hypothetical protein
MHRERAREMLTRHPQCRRQRRDGEVAARAENGAYRPVDTAVDRRSIPELPHQEALEIRPPRAKLAVLNIY